MRLLQVSAAVAATVMLFGCSSAPKVAQSSPPLAPAPAPAPAAPVAKAAPAPAAAVPEYLDPNSPIARQRSVYFGFDDANIRQQDRPVIELQGHYLAAHPSVDVRVEGNTDERGSAEYNLALGQRRAQSVVNALKLMGAKDSQMEAVSWGKEKPKAQGHDEAAWAQNRRVDVVYPTR